MRDQAATPVANSDRTEMIAENMLVAYNSGDYQAPTRTGHGRCGSSSESVPSGGSEARTCRSPAPFKAIISVTPTPGQHDPSHTSYQVRARFEKRAGVLFTMTLSSGSAKVEGVELKAQR